MMQIIKSTAPLGVDVTAQPGLFPTALIEHMHKYRAQLCADWELRILNSRVFAASVQEQLALHLLILYDGYADAFEAATPEALQVRARKLAEQIGPLVAEPQHVLVILLQIRDVLARSLYARYEADSSMLSRALDAFEPAANRISSAVVLNLLRDRERVIRDQQEALSRLATPILQLRRGLLALPLIGAVDSPRARRLTDQLLQGIVTLRASVVVIDITSVPLLDPVVAEQLVQAVEAARLLGAATILTGLSPQLAQTLVSLGVDLGKMRTACDLQSGIEDAERLLALRATPGCD